MYNPFRRIKVSILDREWKPIKVRLKLKHIPTYDELIWIEDVNQYYKVLNVIHSLTKRQTIFIIVDEFVQKPTNNEEKEKK
jgi:hypothetical protein